MKNILRSYFKVFSESRYVLLLNITDKLFSFVIMLLLARNFSTEAYGEIVTLITLTTIFITIFDLGLPIYLQRAVSLDSSKSSEAFSKVFSAGLLLFTFYFLFGFGYLKLFYSGVSVSLFLIIAVMMYSSSLVTLCNKALSGLNDFKHQFIAFITARILILAAFLTGLYFLSFSLNILMFSMLAGFLLNLVLILIYVKKACIRFSFSYFSFGSISSVIKLSIPLGLAVIFNFLYDKIDILLISNLLDFSEVAFYNVGYGLFKASTLSFSFLLVAGFTKVAALGRNKVDITLFFKEYYKIILIICILVSITLYFAAGPLIKLLYTDKFLSSVKVLQILSVGLIGMGLNNLTGITLNGMGYYKIVMYITLYGLVMNVILNVIFIPVYGIIAASVITVITEYFIFLTEYYYLRKILTS